MPLADDTCNRLHVGPDFPALESKGKLQTTQKPKTTEVSELFQIGLQPVGLHFTNCRALQPCICKKEGEKSLHVISQGETLQEIRTFQK